MRLWDWFWRVILRKRQMSVEARCWNEKRSLYERAQEDLGFEPTPAEFANWLRAHWPNAKMKIE